jgi:hypothetical protein
MPRLNALDIQASDKTCEYPAARLQRIWVRIVAFLLGYQLGWFVTLLFIIAAQPLAFWLCRLIVRYLYLDSIGHAPHKGLVAC